MSESHPNGPAAAFLPDASLRVPGLVTLGQNGDKVLVIDPVRGTWGVVDAPLARWLQSRGGRVMSMRDLAAEFGVGVDVLAPMINALAASQLVLLAGRDSQGTHGIVSKARGSLLFLMVRVTERCNLRCAYCYEAAGDHQSLGDMTLPMAQEAIRLFISCCADFATILFNGGEALLRPAFLKRCIAFAHQRARLEGKTLRFAVQTNGTVVTPHVLQFLRGNSVALGVSFDGTASVHDAHRPFRSGGGSAQVVWDNIRRFIDAGIRTSLMVTVTGLNVNALPEICLELQKNGVERVKFSLMAYQGRAATANALAPRADHYTAALARLLGAVEGQTLSALRVEQIINLLNQVLLRERTYLCDQRPCGASGEFLAAFPDGYYYPCDTFPAQAAFRIGRIGESQVDDIESACLRTVLRQRGSRLAAVCVACPLRCLCGGGCPSNANNEHQGVHGVESIVCATSQSLLPQLMWQVVRHSRLLPYHVRHSGLPGAVYLGWDPGTS